MRKDFEASFKLMETAVCRTPAFAMSERLEDCWAALQLLIKESSDSFHKITDGRHLENLLSQDPKIGYSIWKYFNRARFRATPFGEFGALSVIPIRTGKNGLILKNKSTSYIYRDWSEKEIFNKNLKSLTRSSSYFQTNSTIYFINNELRYVFFDGNRFEINSLECTQELRLLLLSCRHKLSKEEIYRLMYSNFGLSRQAVGKLLVKLAGWQLLLPEYFPNISGKDYFERLKMPAAKCEKKYIISERKLISGSLNAGPLSNLPEYLNFISNFYSAEDPENLTAFKRAFQKKFNDSVVSLAVALDPETGVGYGNLAHSWQVSDLVRSIGHKKKAGSFPDKIDFSSAARFLLNELAKGGQVNLEKYGAHQRKKTLPNTISVMMHFYDGQPVIESAGGCTANSLIGRFTSAIPGIAELATSIAAFEQKANPDVLFFDVAYQAERTIDNVNRRALLYEAELPVLSWSCHEHSIYLEDILVALRDDQIVLWSKTYQKRLMPRIPSAYNYNRSDLSLYRFFCDLQFQGLSSRFDFRIRHLLPGLEFYPRVNYKNLIVSPAMWRVEAELNFPLSENQNNSLSRLREWLRKKDINALFRCGQGDQTLCFNPAEHNDLIAFIHYRRQNQNTELYLEEALTDLNSGSADEKGRCFMTQYILGYCQGSNTYSSLPAMFQAEANVAFQPGSNWLYYEIYCHESRSNEILTKNITEIISTYDLLLECWFFIRYSDPAPHIRLRFKLKNCLDSGVLMSGTRAALLELFNSGLISDICLKTYVPEKERYGADQMSEAEFFFCQDSQHVLHVLQETSDETELYHAALAVMDLFCRLTFSGVHEKLIFIKRMSERFSTELSLSASEFKQINLAFKKLGNFEKRTWRQTNYKNLLSRLTRDCKTQKIKEKLLADLLHMHINRLFSGSQRTHEAILYHFYLKYLLRRSHLIDSHGDS